MPGLSHDGSLRGASNRRGCGMPGPQTVPRIVRRLQPRPFCQFLDQARNVDTGQPVGLYLGVTIDRPEQRAGADSYGL